MRQLLTAILCIALLAQSALATFRNFTGFEIGSSADANTTSGTFSIQSSTVRTGTYALRVNPTTTGAGYFSLAHQATTTGLVTTNLQATYYVRMYFRYATKPSSSNEYIAALRDSTQNKFGVGINSSGQLTVYDRTGTLQGTGTTALSQDTWYRIDFTAGTSATASYEVRINGASELSGTIDTGATNTEAVRLGKVANLNGNSVDFYYDDVAWEDSTWAPDGKSLLLLATANGATMDFTTGTNSSNYAEVDEVPTDSDTTYIKNAAASGLALMAFQDTADVGIFGTINAIKLWVTTREDTSATSATTLKIRSGGSDANTSSGYNGSTSYENRFLIRSTDPNTSTAWTTSGVDAVEAGVNEANAVSDRISNIAILIDWTPSETLRSLPLLGVGK